MSFATVLCLIPENGRPAKITGNGLAAGCQLFYRKIYGHFYSACLVVPPLVRADSGTNLIKCVWGGRGGGQRTTKCLGSSVGGVLARSARGPGFGSRSSKIFHPL